MAEETNTETTLQSTGADENGLDTAAGENVQGASESGHFSAGLADEAYREKYSRFQDLDAFAKAYDELETKLGAGDKGIQPLPEDATPEQVAEFRKAVHGDAYPDEAKNYSVTMPDLPESAGDMQPAIAGFLQVMHEAGAPAPVVQAALNYWGGLQSQLPEAQRAAYAAIDEANTAHFAQLWGSQAQNNLRVAAESVRRDFGQEAMDLLFDVGDNGGVKPIQSGTFLYEVLYDYGMTHGHHAFVITDGSGNFVRPEDASKEADRLDQDHLAGKISDLEYQQRLNELMRVAEEGNVRSIGREAENVGVSHHG